MNNVACEPLTYKQIHPLALAHQCKPEAPKPVPVAPVLPESPCSVNAVFELGGYGRLQATGRGFTPQQAAENLRDTIEATRAALLPPPIEQPKSRVVQGGGA